MKVAYFSGAEEVEVANMPAIMRGEQGPQGTIYQSFRGVWSNATAYAAGDIVTYNWTINNVKSSHLFIAHTAHTSAWASIPGPDTYAQNWTIFLTAAQGANGAQGPVGPAPVVQVFDTFAEASAFSTANPTAIVFSREPQ